MKLERALDLITLAMCLPFIACFVVGSVGMQLGFVCRESLDRILGIKPEVM